VELAYGIETSEKKNWTKLQKMEGKKNEISERNEEKRGSKWLRRGGGC